jgi:hypothetical protein
MASSGLEKVQKPDAEAELEQLREELDRKLANAAARAAQRGELRPGAEGMKQLFGNISVDDGIKSNDQWGNMTTGEDSGDNLLDDLLNTPSRGKG